MIFDCLDIADIIGFDWDKGNMEKNEKKHNLKWNIIEEIFYNIPLMIIEDKVHSQSECRCRALGTTNTGLYLFVVFVTRENKIRIISARMMNKKEREIYENFKTNTEL